MKGEYSVNPRFTIGVGFPVGGSRLTVDPWNLTCVLGFVLSVPLPPAPVLSHRLSFFPCSFPALFRSTRSET